MKLVLAASLLWTATVYAAPPGPRDPDWPCQQIKVPQLSLASVWSGPPVPDDWRQDQQVTDLAQTVVQRRLPIEQAQQSVREFARQAGEQKQAKLLELMAGLFRMLDDERSSVVAGLDRFGARQKELAAQLRDDNEKLRVMQADSSSDAGDINQMTQRITWEAQIFQDRRQSLSYACDVPGKIEQRLFALARTVQELLQ
jgi:hypothetical protein